MSSQEPGRRIPLSCFLCALLACGPYLAAAPKTDNSLPPNLDSAIGKGIAFLAKQQSAEGSFDHGGPKTAMTALSLLAFLSAGHTPDLGRYGLVVRAATDYVLAQQNAEGYFGSGDRGMYTHAIATLALCQAYGVQDIPDRRLRIHTALRKAVDLILSAQSAPKSDPAFVGGWRYEPKSPDSDLSLSGWNTLALRAAQDAGLHVPADAADRAVEFVLRCYNANDKAFAYQPGQGVQPGDSGIGVLCLYLLDASEKHHEQIHAAVAYLAAHPIDEAAAFPYYGTYYITQAGFQHGGDAWAKIARPGLERLIKLQDKDGGWPPSKSGQEPGRVYATAMAVQALAVPYRLLPVYQR